MPTDDPTLKLPNENVPLLGEGEFLNRLATIIDERVKLATTLMIDQFKTVFEKLLQDYLEPIREDINLLKEGQQRLETKVHDLKNEVHDLKEGQERLEAEVSELKERQQRVETEVRGLAGKVADMAEAVTDFRRFLRADERVRLQEVAALEDRIEALEQPRH